VQTDTYYWLPTDLDAIERMRAIFDDAIAKGTRRAFRIATDDRGRPMGTRGEPLETFDPGRRRDDPRGVHAVSFESLLAEVSELADTDIAARGPMTMTRDESVIAGMAFATLGWVRDALAEGRVDEAKSILDKMAALMLRMRPPGLRDPLNDLPTRS
jgi:hypothetical protein